MGIYKPNSGIDGCLLVLPNDNNCPCCGAKWVHESGGKRMTDGDNVVRPSCMQVRGSGGQPVGTVLIWVCQRCTCEVWHNDK